MMLRQKRVIIPALLLALIISTLAYGYHGEYGNPFGRRRPPTSATHGEAPGFGGPGFGGDGEYAHKGHSRLPANGSAEANFWTAEEVAAIPKWNVPSHEDKVVDPVWKGQPHADRVRYEISDVWRTEDTLVDNSVGNEGLVRFKVPQRSQYDSAGQYLRQPLPGNFHYGADKIFMMVKTGADTQWKRMPLHFLTDLTHAQNFALYSDAPGSMFGHEIIDILRTLPEDVLEEQWELKRYRAHLQSHDEHWNWAPESLKADGGWLVDRYKNVPMLLDAYKKNPNCDWYAWVDDDSYVFYDNLVKWMATMDPNEMVYTGSAAGLAYNDESFYFAHGGSVVVVSHAVVEALFGPPGKRKHDMTDDELITKWARLATPICCGDALFALMLIKELDLIMYTHPEFGEYLWWGSPFQGEGLESLIIPPERFCVPICTWHHLTSHEVELLYSYERLWDLDRAITYHDIYRDFYLPYVVDERPNWKIPDEPGRAEIFPREDASPSDPVEFDGQTYHPAQSKEECKRLCQDKSGCMGWTWKHEYCMVQSTGFIFGAAANKWNEREGYVSGWMVDRIREWRVNSACDPLERVDGVFNDDENTSEGWMIRKMQKEEASKFSYPEDSTYPKLSG